MSRIDGDAFYNALFPGEAAGQAQKSVVYATITGFRPNGGPIIRFDGDSQPSQKTYKCFRSFLASGPAIGDRVMLVNNVVIGGWKP